MEEEPRMDSIHYRQFRREDTDGVSLLEFNNLHIIFKGKQVPHLLNKS